MDSGVRVCFGVPGDKGFSWSFTCEGFFIEGIVLRVWGCAGLIVTIFEIGVDSMLRFVKVTFVRFGLLMLQG